MRAWRSANDYAKLDSLILNVETRSSPTVRGVLPPRDGSSPRARARVQDIHICRKHVLSDLDYGASCFAEIENRSKKSHSAGMIFDTISLRYHRDITRLFPLSILSYYEKNSYTIIYNSHSMLWSKVYICIKYPAKVLLIQLFSILLKNTFIRI